VLASYCEQVAATIFTERASIAGAEALADGRAPAGSVGLADGELDLSLSLMVPVTSI
jgi:hypothetical protein